MKMTAVVSVLAVVLAAADLAVAKVYERCELARELASVHGVPREDLPVWVCIAQHESTYNTSAVGHVGEGGDHGLFQISDLYWCSHRGAGKACGVSCEQLLDDDISDDVACMRRIHREHQGLAGNGWSAWAVYPLYCKQPERVAKYVEGCFPGAANEIQPQPFYGLPPPAITAPPPPRYHAYHPQTTPRPAPAQRLAAAYYGLPPAAAPRPAPRPVSAPAFSRWSFPRFTTSWTAPSPPPPPPPPRRLPQPQRPASDPSNFWNWQFLSRRRWF